MAARIRPERPSQPKPAKMRAASTITGQCLCGAVEIETDAPVFWAFHDHSAATRRAHGAAYATYVGCWKSKVRITKGEGAIARFEDSERLISDFGVPREVISTSPAEFTERLLHALDLTVEI